MESWTKGQQMVLKRNPHYWQEGKPYLDSVTFLTIPDDNTRLIQLKGGDVDIMEAPPYSSVAGLQEHAQHRGRSLQVDRGVVDRDEREEAAVPGPSRSSSHLLRGRPRVDHQ